MFNKKQKEEQEDREEAKNERWTAGTWNIIKM